MNRQPATGNRQSSFTLIELLVVIAVIAVLTAMLLPALKGARETSKRSVCMGHLRQVSLAMFMLADDNDGWMNGVNSSTYTNAWTWDYHWQFRMTNYLGAAMTILKPFSNAGCPSKNPQNPHWNWPPYGVNSMFSGWTSQLMHRVSETRNTARVFLAADCWYPQPADPTTIDNYVYQPFPVHQGKGLNFVMVDGHGEFLPVKGGLGDYASPWWRTRPSATEWPPYNNIGSWPPPIYSGLWGD